MAAKESYSQILVLLKDIEKSKDLELRYEVLSLIRAELNALLKSVEAAKKDAPIDLEKLTRYLICDSVTGKVIGKFEDGVLKLA